VIEKGRERDANAVDKLELDRLDGRVVGSGDVERLLAVVFCLESTGGVLPVENGVVVSVCTSMSPVHGPLEDPVDPYVLCWRPK
jgi:hypothetical protein